MIQHGSVQLERNSSWFGNNSKKHTLVGSPIASGMLVNPSDFTRENGARLLSTMVGDHMGIAGGDLFLLLWFHADTVGDFETQVIVFPCMQQPVQPPFLSV
jgi:hypothetical protein